MFSYSFISFIYFILFFILFLFYFILFLFFYFFIIVRRPPSAVRHPPSAIRHPPSAIRHPPSGSALYRVPRAPPFPFVVTSTSWVLSEVCPIPFTHPEFEGMPCGSNFWHMLKPYFCGVLFIMLCKGGSFSLRTIVGWCDYQGRPVFLGIRYTGAC